MIKKTKKSKLLIQTRERALFKAKIRTTMDATLDEEEVEIMMPLGMPPPLMSLLDPGCQELEDRGIIIINSMISKMTLDRAFKKLVIIDMDDEFTDPVQIILNSPGGYCDAGWAFIDMMDSIKNDITTVAMGEICSMATSIFIAGDTRIMSPNSTAMIHQFASYNEGTYGDLVANRKAEDIEQEKSLDHLVRYSKYNNKAEIKKYILKEHDHWLTPTEMKKHGLCDKVIRSSVRKKKKTRKN